MLNRLALICTWQFPIKFLNFHNFLSQLSRLTLCLFHDSTMFFYCFQQVLPFIFSTNYLCIKTTFDFFFKQSDFFLESGPRWDISTKTRLRSYKEFCELFKILTIINSCQIMLLNFANLMRYLIEEIIDEIFKTIDNLMRSNFMQFTEMWFVRNKLFIKLVFEFRGNIRDELKITLALGRIHLRQVFVFVNTDIANETILFLWKCDYLMTTHWTNIIIIVRAMHRHRNGWLLTNSI